VTLSAPLVGLTRISSPFGVQRGTRDDGTPILHNGTDWPAPEGTPLHAMSDGTVVFRLQPPDNSGNAIGVRTPDGRTTWSFSHMSRVDVRVGERVRRGQVVGTVGWTGKVSPPGPAGSHVHVRVDVDGRTVDPAKQLGTAWWKKALVGAAAGAAFVAFRAAGDVDKYPTMTGRLAPPMGDPLAYKLALAAAAGGTKQSGAELERGGQNGPRAAGVWRTEWSALTRRAGGDTRPQLRRLDQLVDALVDERDRINAERLKLLAGRATAIAFWPPLALFDPGEIQTRADSMLALLEQIDIFVGQRLPRLEEKARAGDVKAADDAVEGAELILTAVGGISPVSDFIDDTTAFVKETAGETKSTFKALTVIGGVIATALVVREARGVLREVFGGP
jgi:hypothetical protein